MKKVLFTLVTALLLTTSCQQNASEQNTSSEVMETQTETAETMRAKEWSVRKP